MASPSPMASMLPQSMAFGAIVQAIYVGLFIFYNTNMPLGTYIHQS
jgi:hypothetical protein